MKKHLSVSSLGHYCFMSTMVLAIAVTVFPLSGCNIIQKASEKLEDPVQVQKYADQIEASINFGVTRSIQADPTRIDKLRPVVLALDVLIGDRIVSPSEVTEVFEDAGILDMESSAGFYAIMASLGLYDVLFRENVDAVLSGDIDFLPFLVALRDGMSDAIDGMAVEGASPFQIAR